MTLKSLGCWQNAKDEVGEFFFFFFLFTVCGLAALSVHPDTFIGSQRRMAHSSGLAPRDFFTAFSCHANRWLCPAKLQGGGDVLSSPPDP